MANLHITLIDVRAHVAEREIDLKGTPGNPTLMGNIAKAVTLAMTGKNQKQARDRVTGFLTIVASEQVAAASDGIDDPRTEADVDSSFEGSLDDLTAEADAGDQTEASLGDDEAEASDDTSEEGDEGEEEPAGEKSVVKSKYRLGYKQNGNARGNNDWMHRMLNGLTLGAKKKLNFDAFSAICAANGCSEDLAKFTTAGKRLTNGWTGRARMSGGLCLRQRCADNNSLAIPRAIWEAGKERLAANNKRATEGGKPQLFVEWTVDNGEDEGDEIVFLSPAGEDRHFFNQVLAARADNKEKLAEGRKKAKAGKVAE